MLIFDTGGYRINFGGTQLLTAPAPALNQQHTNRVLTAYSNDIPADGIILPREAASCVALRTADCAPIILVSQTRIALIHAGWRGLSSNIINVAIDHFAPGEIKIAVVGPSAHSCCYAFDMSLPPYSVTEYRDGTQYLSISATAAKQLEVAGILVKSMNHCTICSKQFHSYRRDREVAGRNWSWVTKC